MISSASARWRRSTLKPRGQEQRGAGEAGAVAGFERDLQRLAHREIAEETGGLERPAEAAPGSAFGCEIA